MKIRNIAAAATLAIAALASPAARAAANGDIFEILPVERVDSEWVFSQPAEPLDAGDMAYFVVRLMKPSPGSNQFRLVHRGSASEAVDWAAKRPSIGIYVNGAFTVARLEDCHVRDDNIFTDLVFSYTARPGDFALPIRLALANKSMVADANDEPSGSYYLDFLDRSLPDAPAWSVDDSTENEPATRDANFFYGSMRYSATSPDASGTGRSRTTDYDLSKCNFMVRTVDFDPNPESTDYWRAVYRHESIAQPVGRTPSLVVSGMPTNSTTLYVWSENPEAVVLIDGGDVASVSTRLVHTNATETAERRVGVVKIVAGKREYGMNLRGVLATNDATIVLSASPDFRYDSLNERLDDEYLTRVVRCFGAMPPPPTVSNVVARQRWPWNGLVDVDYEVGGDPDELARLGVEISFAEQGGAGRVWVATNFLAGAEPSAEYGPHRATWDTKAAGATDVVAAKVVATVSLARRSESSTEAVTLGVVNAYAMEVDKATVEVVCADGEDDWTAVVEDAAFDPSDGSCSVALEIPRGAKVRSVVLRAGGVPFEWLDYAEPVPFAGGALVLDPDDNEFANGAYAAGTEMQVANPRHLDNVRRHPAGSFRQTGDIDFAGSCGIANAIEVREESGTVTISCTRQDAASSLPKPRFYGGTGDVYGWVPIGDGDAAFGGVYDGGGHAISNLVGNAVDKRDSVCALFGRASGTAERPVVIKGVNIADDCSFCASSAAAALLAEASGSVEIGGADAAACRIAGEVYAGDVAAGVLAQSDGQGGASIELAGCTVVGRIYGRRCGGLVGVAGKGPLELHGCVLGRVDEDDEDAASITSIFAAGGLVCSYRAADKDADSCLIDDCHSHGTMSFFQDYEDREIARSSHGGFVGYLQGDFTLLADEDKPAILEITGQCEIKSRMLYDSGNIYRVGGVLGYTSYYSADELKHVFDGVVSVESGCIPESVGANYIGQYCGDPWLDDTRL